MPKYRINLNGYASATITVETDETDPERIFEEAMQKGVPTLCAQCSGWGRDHSLDLGDEWEPSETNEDDIIVVYKEED